MSNEYAAERISIAAEQLREGITSDALRNLSLGLTLLLESGDVDDTLAAVFDDIPERLSELSDAIDNA